MTIVLEEWSVLWEPKLVLRTCRDPDDNYLLALAETSQANYLVTRDEDLLSLKQWKDTRIIYPARLLTILEELQ